MKYRDHIQHLKMLNSVNWFRVLKRFITFLPEVFLSEGYSSTLLNITMELTSRCNLDCAHCFFVNDNIQQSVKTELTLDKIKKVVKEVSDVDVSFFLTGGEPFMRKDILDIVKIIKKYKLKCGINTNGILLNKRKIVALSEIGLDYIIITLCGPEHVHDKIVGTTGAYDKTIENIRLLSKYGKELSVYINCPILENNLPCLEEILFLAMRYNIDGLRYQHYSFLTSSDMKKIKNIQNEQLKKYSNKISYSKYDPVDFSHNLLYKKIQKVNQIAKYNDLNVFFKPLLDKKGIKNWYGDNFYTSKKCFYPWIETRVAPNGDIFPCPIIRIKLGNIINSSILKVQNSPKYKFFRKLLRKEKGYFPFCARCCKLYMNPFGKI